MTIFGLTINNKQNQIKQTIINEGKEKAYQKYMELCKGHTLVDAIKFVDRVAAKM